MYLSELSPFSQNPAILTSSPFHLDNPGCLSFMYDVTDENVRLEVVFWEGDDDEEGDVEVERVGNIVNILPLNIVIDVNKIKSW